MYTTKPLGAYHFQFCHTLSCELAGSEEVIQHFEKRLGIKPGETTEDGLFTLSRVECLASCGTAPICQVNREYHENLTPETLDILIDHLRQEAKTNA